MLHCEVMSAFSDFSVGRTSKAMPSLSLASFVITPPVADHIRNKHTDRVKFVCSGTKQMKVIMSMYSLDSFTGRHPGNYLQRSSDLIRVSASSGGSATDNSIDRILRVVLTSTGPTVVQKSTLCAVHKVRRVGNVLFTRCFAEVFLRLMLLNDSRLRRCMDLFQTHIQLSGNELGLLVPEHPKTMRTSQLCFSFWLVLGCCVGVPIPPL